MDRDATQQLVGASRAMTKLRVWISKAARSPIPVLLLGESGTGKGLVAREIHRRSGRASGPFVAADLGAIPSTLVESELFGHVKGAYTGAVGDREGAFREADGGVLLLDEVGNAPAEVQMKLLRAIEEGEVTPVGANTPVPVDVRVVAATNVDLRQRVAERRFRKDLFFRLSVLTRTLPPLRDRGGDLELLVPHLLERAMEEHRREWGTSDPTPELSRQAWQAVRTHAWPGNVRELFSCLRRAVVLAEGGVIRAADLGIGEGLRIEFVDAGVRAGERAGSGEFRRPAVEPRVRDGPGGSRQADPGGVLPMDHPARWTGPDGEFLDWEESRRAHIRAALRVSAGNVTQAADLLGVARSTLRGQMGRLGIDPGDLNRE